MSTYIPSGTSKIHINLKKYLKRVNTHIQNVNRNSWEYITTYNLNPWDSDMVGRLLILTSSSKVSKLTERKKQNKTKPVLAFLMRIIYKSISNMLKSMFKEKQKLTEGQYSPTN